MEPALVSQDESWHQNMLRKWLDKNNRIRLCVFEEVCWRLIKDSDLCSLHQKKQILCILKNGTFYLGCNVKYTQQTAQNTYGELSNGQEMKNNSSTLGTLSDIFGDQFHLLNISLFCNVDSCSIRLVPQYQHVWNDCTVTGFYIAEKSLIILWATPRCFVELFSDCWQLWSKFRQFRHSSSLCPQHWSDLNYSITWHLHKCLHWDHCTAPD